MKRLLALLIMVAAFCGCDPDFDAPPMFYKECSTLQANSSPSEKQRCESYIQSILQEKTTNPQEKQNHTNIEKLAKIISRIFYEPIDWPSDNRLFAFPTIQVPNSLICRIAPSEKPMVCGYRLQQNQTHIRQNLVSLLIINVHSWLFSPKPYHSRPDVIAYAHPLSRVELYPIFWNKPWADQISTLLHELQHFQNTSPHAICTGSWNNNARLCDKNMESGRFSSEILFHELLIRGLINKTHEISSNELPSIKNQIADLITAQCFYLQAINEHPTISSEFSTCSKQESLSLVEKSPLLTKQLAQK